MRYLWIVLVAVMVAGLGCAGSSNRESPDRTVGTPPEETDDSVAGLASEDEPSPSRGDRDAESSGPADSASSNAIDELFPEERVTLDFREARVQRVLRLFRAKSRVEFVVAPEVDGRITVQMEDAPASEAFRAVLQAADLVCERRDEILLIRPRGSSDAADDQG